MIYEFLNLGELRSHFFPKQTISMIKTAEEKVLIYLKMDEAVIAQNWIMRIFHTNFDKTQDNR